MAEKVIVSPKLRTIFLVGEVTPKMATMFRLKFLRLTHDRPSAPITVEINSEGGNCEAGLVIADTIRNHTPGVTTIAAGSAMSMASVILAAGQKRLALPSSIIMVHPGWSYVKGKEHELGAEYEEAKRVQLQCWDLLDQFTDKPTGYWNAACDRRNLYLTPQQAQQHGLIHEVVA